MNLKILYSLQHRWIYLRTLGETNQNTGVNNNNGSWSKYIPSKQAHLLHPFWASASPLSKHPLPLLGCFKMQEGRVGESQWVSWQSLVKHACFLLSGKPLDPTEMTPQLWAHTSSSESPEQRNLWPGNSWCGMPSCTVKTLQWIGLEIFCREKTWARPAWNSYCSRPAVRPLFKGS